MEPLMLTFKVKELAETAPYQTSWVEGDIQPSRDATSIKAVAHFIDNRRSFSGSLHISLPNDSQLVPQLGETLIVTITKEK